MQYGVTGYHPNCYDNLLQRRCASWGSSPSRIATAFNFFMNVDIVDGGRLQFAPPRSRPGDALLVRAEMDLAIAITACPASTCNGGAPPRPLAFEVRQ